MKYVLKRNTSYSLQNINDSKNVLFLVILELFSLDVEYFILLMFSYFDNNDINLLFLDIIQSINAFYTTNLYFETCNINDINKSIRLYNGLWKYLTEIRKASVLLLL